MTSRRRRAMPVLAALVALLATLAAGLSPAAGVSSGPAGRVSADPVDTTPHALDGKVLAVAEVGNVVYVGGTFTTIRNATSSTRITRARLFAYDRTTGRIIDGFNPKPDGTVETLAPGPNGTVIVGGRFSTIAGGSQRGLAMLTSAGARVTSFTAKTNGRVNKVVVRNNRLFAAGSFTTANGTNRQNLAAFNATTGALESGFDVPVTNGRTKADGTTTKASVTEMDANPAGTRLVVVGNFQTVQGQSRMQVAMVNLQTNQLGTWSTTRFPNAQSGPNAYQCFQVFDTSVQDVEYSPDGSYFVIVTTGGAGDRNANSLCDTATRWANTDTAGSREIWKNCTGGDSLFAVAVTPGVIYVGGHQRWQDNCGGRDSQTAGAWPQAAAGADTYLGIAALNPGDGRVMRDWYPGRNPRGHGVEELVGTATGLYVGMDTNGLGRNTAGAIGKEFHARFGLFPAG